MAESKIDKLRKIRDKLVQGGGEKRIAKQHELGKLTARERLALLYDEDSFRESLLFMKNRCTDFGMDKKEFPGEGVVTGIGFVDGRPVYAGSQDFTVAGGSVGDVAGRKIQEAMDLYMPGARISLSPEARSVMLPAGKFRRRWMPL